MMSGNFLARVTVIAFALLLAACGGGGGGSDDGSLGGPDNGGGSNGGGGEQTADVGTVQLTASPITLGSSASSVSTITVFVRDDNNRVMSGVPVEFSADSDAVLTINRDVTDDAGNAEATLSTPTNPSNRTIVVSATAGGETESIQIQVSGTRLTLSGPRTIPVNSSASYTARILDSNDNGVSGQEMEIRLDNDQNSVSPQSVTTNDGGEATFSITGGAPGADTLTVSAFSGQSSLSTSQSITISNDNFRIVSPNEGTEIALGQSQDITVEWVENGAPVPNEIVNFYTTRGSLAVASGQTMTNSLGQASMAISSNSAGPATVEVVTGDGQFSAKQDILFFSNNPSKITVRADKTQLNVGEETRVRAILRDANNNLVKNRTVVFNIEQDVSGGRLLGSYGTTDSLGRVSVVYQAGSGSGTARDGVIISATEQESIDTSNPIREEAVLTVTDGGLRITLGTGNDIIEPDADHYTKDWVVFVTNANGEPVENAEVELSVLPTRYQKGYYVPADCDGNGTNDCWAPAYTVLANPPEKMEDGCPAEDINQNGINDAGEDINGNDKLDPSNDAVVIADNVKSTNNGSVHFQLTYPQSNCNWTEVRIEARTTVDGTEYSESASTLLSCSASDLTNLDASPPSISGGSKYGQSNSCEDAL